MREIHYTAAGPVADAFMNSDAFVTGILGPIGSSKSTTCIMKLARAASLQMRMRDGWRRRRSAIIRNTMPELRMTTIKSWQQWFPKETGIWKESGPVSHHFTDHASKFDWEIIFLAMDRPDDVKKALSFEISDVWINEAREIPKAIVDALTGRVGRFPPRDGDFMCTDPQVVMDTNAPDTDHWWYRLAEEPTAEDDEQIASLTEVLLAEGALRPGQKLFDWYRQPGGRDPGAENLENLIPGYYAKASAGKSQDWIRVYINADYGYVQDGKPVYPDYRDQTHCREFEPNPRLPLDIGIDFGLTPAAIFAQQQPNGQWRKHSELVTEDMGIVRFAELFKNHLEQVYPGYRIRSITGDPAGDIRNDDERTTYDILKTGGIEAKKASTNEPTLRIESVSGTMRRMIDGEPGMIIHPRCRVLRKGYQGAYCYRRLAVSGEAKFRDVPDKNMHSHIADADQYLMIGNGEGKSLVRAERPKNAPPRERLAKTEYSMFGDD